MSTIRRVIIAIVSLFIMFTAYHTVAHAAIVSSTGTRIRIPSYRPHHATDPRRTTVTHIIKQHYTHIAVKSTHSKPYTLHTVKRTPMQSKLPTVPTVHTTVTKTTYKTTSLGTISTQKTYPVAIPSPRYTVGQFVYTSSPTTLYAVVNMHVVSNQWKYQIAPIGTINAVGWFDTSVLHIATIAQVTTYLQKNG